MIGDEALDPLPGLDGVLLHLLRYLPGGKRRAPITVAGDRDARQNPTTGRRRGFPSAAFAADTVERINRLHQGYFSTVAPESTQRLRTALTKATFRGGLDHPTISDPKARRLLPELIKATQTH